MDAIATTSSFHYVMSKFADLLIKVKQRMDKLRSETREAVDKLKEEGNGTELCTDYQGRTDLKSLIDATIVDLEKRLIALETFCNKNSSTPMTPFLYQFFVNINRSFDCVLSQRANSRINTSLVRMFLYVSNYTSTVPKLDEGHEKDTSKLIHTHNIVFPDYEDDFEFNEKFLFNECFMDDASEATDDPRSCRRPSDLQREQFCLNKQY